MVRSLGEWLEQGRDFLKRFVSFVQRRINLVEVKILVIGMVMAVLLWLFMTTLIFIRPDLYQMFATALVAHIMGSRALGIFSCVSAGLSPFWTLVYNFYVEIMIVFLYYAVIILIMRNVIHLKIFHQAVRQAEQSAEKRQHTLKRYGAIGLFLFAMFPFVGTGPVMGAVIGALLKYHPVTNFAIALGGSLVALIIYLVTGHNLIDSLHTYLPADKVQDWGTILIFLILGGGILYHFGRKYFSRNKSS
jgi:uncharacterized membrane protein